MLRGAQARAQWRRARFASHAVTKWVLARKRKEAGMYVRAKYTERERERETYTEVF